MRPIDLAADETATFILDQIPSTHVRILDVGCGDGLLASRLQAHGHDVVAIDESAELVQKARALGVDARVAAWPSFEDIPFDIVIFMLKTSPQQDEDPSSNTKTLHTKGAVVSATLCRFSRLG